MAQQALVWNKGRVGQSAVLRPLTVYPPACASSSGAAVIINAQGQMVCVKPEFLPEGKKQVPSCGPGLVPVLDTRVTEGSGWSCLPTGPAQAADKDIPLPLVIIGGAALLGLVWWAAR